MKEERNNIPIDQGTLLRHLTAISKWMMSYEQYQHKMKAIKINFKSLPKEHMTQEISLEGVCHGLVIYLAHCIMTDEQIERKKRETQPQPAEAGWLMI